MAPRGNRAGNATGGTNRGTAARPVARRLERKLRAAFAPVRLSLVDESRHHAGHAAAVPGAETHFRLEIVARSFVGRSRLERNRMIYRVLAEELAGPVHALSITARAPGEGSDDSRRNGTATDDRAD